VLQKAELSFEADSENYLGGSSETMYYIGLDVHKKTISYCVKDAAGKIHQEGKIGSTRRELDSWIKTLPQPRTIAMEATIFTGWIYDHLLPHAEKVKVAHPLMLRAIAAAKRKNDKIDASKIADCLRCDFLPECHMASTEKRRRHPYIEEQRIAQCVQDEIRYVLQGTFGSKSVGDGPAFLSELLFYCAAISATKRVPSSGYEYALRVNPSSGNLHPTEFHFVTRGLRAWPDGLYHYDPSRHMAEQRGRGTFEMRLASGPAPIVFVFTSIVWREAWKYGERAYRYCLHDIGHAWQALALSARAIGCNAFAVGSFVDDEVAQLCRPNVDEWPMLIVSLHGKSIPVREADTGKTVWFGGQANLLSKETIAQPLIDSLHIATKQSSSGSSGTTFAEPVPTGSDGIELPPPASSTRSFGEVARMRRSALNFMGGEQSISLAGLTAILTPTAQALLADFAITRFIQLYLYVHRVE
jgi:SagB-type dehydrogenase family enzyme